MRWSSLYEWDYIQHMECTKVHCQKMFVKNGRLLAITTPVGNRNVNTRVHLGCQLRSWLPVRNKSIFTKTDYFIGTRIFTLLLPTVCLNKTVTHFSNRVQIWLSKSEDANNIFRLKPLRKRSKHNRKRSVVMRPLAPVVTMVTTFNTRGWLRNNLQCRVYTRYPFVNRVPNMVSP